MSHEPCCRRHDLVSFDGITSCLSCGCHKQDEPYKRLNNSVIHEFSYLALKSPSKVRLALLLLGEYSDPTQCELSVADVNQLPDYHAVSYTWVDENGDTSKSKSISLCSQPFAVTKGL